MCQSDGTVLESPSHVVRLIETFLDVVADKHSTENFNCRLGRRRGGLEKYALATVRSETDLFEERGVHQPVERSEPSTLAT